MKYLRITMPDGSRWDVPASLVEDSFKAHYGQPLVSRAELFDWAANNMNWEDVSIHARQVSPPYPVDFQEGWVNGEKQVVEY